VSQGLQIGGASVSAKGFAACAAMTNCMIRAPPWGVEGHPEFYGPNRNQPEGISTYREAESSVNCIQKAKSHKKAI